MNNQTVKKHLSVRMTVLEQWLKNDKFKDQEVSFTLDKWTSKSNESMLGMTAHFIDDDWKLQHFAIECNNMESLQSSTKPGDAAAKLWEECKSVLERYFPFETATANSGKKKWSWFPNVVSFVSDTEPMMMNARIKNHVI